MTMSDVPIVFVYGSLRRGGANHHLMERAESLGNGTIEASLYVSGSLSMVHEGSGTVHGEVYHLPDQNHLRSLDVLERHPTWYERRIVRVTLEDGTTVEAWCYFKTERDPEARLLDHGDYLRLREEQ